MANSKSNETVVVLGRWQPVHIGHQAALQSLCKQFNNVNIGIGSSNIHNYRNPFSLDDVTEMLLLTLKNFENFKFTPVPDLLDPQKWCELVISKFGQPEIFVTSNPYVKHLLGSVFHIKHPVNFIPEEEKREVNATMVRKMMALGKGWQVLVPDGVADYIIKRNLDDRFRNEFGLQTLSMDVIVVE